MPSDLLEQIKATMNAVQQNVESEIERWFQVRTAAGFRAMEQEMAAVMRKGADAVVSDILKAITINGSEAAGVIGARGPIKPGLAADLIAVAGNPLEDIDALREVRFVMKNGQVFKKDGVMVPEKLFHPGPVNGWRRR